MAKSLNQGRSLHEDELGEAAESNEKTQEGETQREQITTEQTEQPLLCNHLLSS